MECTILSNFFSNLPHKPYCSDDLQYGLEILPKKHVSEKKYVQFNPPGITRYICLDIDGDALGALDTAIAPQPNIITLNSSIRPGEKGPRGHLLYELQTPVNTGKNGRLPPRKLLHSVKRGLTGLLGADIGYQHFITKNPLSPQFNGIPIHDKKWELLELLDWIPDELTKARTPTTSESALGRNSALFRSSRHFAYSIVGGYKERGQRDGFEDAVFQFAYRANQLFSDPLGEKEVRAITKSISKWSWNSYDPSRPYRLGILTPEQKQFSGTERQAIGAHHTNSKRREESGSKLQAAIDSVKESADNPTQKRVAEKSGLSLRTVKRYWAQLVD
ncbi:hypothetical protein HKX42_03300 [Salinisphaera sp. USBA-960]|nr:hypothetical protein [Salifodinibacter halophilus]NNC25905.1 hypothetical protein [Salifodinibacter halophilus]